jgi:cytosine/adenosine deaminase-related metal-dependent hydrolase
VTAWLAELAWLGGEGLASDVVIACDGAGRLVRVAPGQAAPADAVRLRGVVLPGLANVHSHAFHRALRGRVQSGAADFWRWRDRMYALAAVLDPDGLFELARAVYAEMALAGMTVVGEFHYLHHRPGGGPYADPNAMGRALVDAAAEVGIRLTLLDACYLRGGFGGEPLAGVQERFGDGDAEGWATRVAGLAAPVDPGATRDHQGDAAGAGSGRGGVDGQPPAGWRLGAAVHSVRAVDVPSMRVVADWAARNAAPLHLHLSEQPAENEQALAATGCTPARLAGDAGALGPRTAAVHATHLAGDDITLLCETGTAVCLCPTTERDLGDGVGPADRLAAAGCPLSLGSDSHAVIDLFEEARLVELHRRLVRHERGAHDAPALLGAATAGGYRALGWSEGGELVLGALADFVVVDHRSVRLAGLDPARGAAALVYGASAADVSDVVVGGRTVVRDGEHVGLPDVAAALDRSIRSLGERL